jgi:hypothetical protein
MEQIIPSYTGLLKDAAQLPDEFERQFWVSCVEALLEKLKSDYQKYQAMAQRADLLGKTITLMADVVLKAGGKEPIPLPDSLRIGISIYPSGRIEPALIDDPNKLLDAIVVTYDEFIAIVQRLKDKLLKGTIVPTSEVEIPKLLHNEALL